MAEIRKHDPETGEGLARLVREAMGETIRPIEPGTPAEPAESQEQGSAEPDDASPAAIPVWDESGPMFHF